MASLTPLSKGLLGLAVVGAMASAVWHLGLKEKLAGNATQANATTSVPQDAAVKSPTPAIAPMVQDTNLTNGKASGLENAELGRKLLDTGDYAKARTHLEVAVQAGDAGAACHLGEMTLKGQGGINANQEKAAALFQLAQSRGAICFASGK
jgi:TPR repeat protein